MRVRKMGKTYYELPGLPFKKSALEPHMSELQLSIHHDKHHRGYVDKSNEILKKLEVARKDGTDIDMKPTLKALSFNIGGHVLHSLFWPNLAPAGEGGGGAPSGKLGSALEREFGSFERFRQEFTQAAASVEGSGWAALAFDAQTQHPFIMQIEKHNVNLYPNFKIVMVVDVWEHAYYLDYQNRRAKFLEAFWEIVNWEEVERRSREACEW